MVGLTSLALAASLPAAAAEVVAPPPPPKATKPFNKRDFSGTWDRYPQAIDTQRDRTVVAPPPDIPPPPLKAQYKADYDAHMAKVAAANARNEPIATGYTHCLPDGMPAMMQAMFPMEVIQAGRQVTIVQEAYNQVRRIYIGDKLPAVEDAEPLFWGHSVGRWVGDRFIVDTLGIKETVRFRDVPHSDQMRIHEEMTVLGPNHFQNRITVTDPVYLTGPWSWTWIYQRRAGYKMQEYVCEDNREYADPVTGAARLRLSPTP
jgi:hypothetical protein